jgi:hypothetical protein
MMFTKKDFIIKFVFAAHLLTKNKLQDIVLKFNSNREQQS